MIENLLKREELLGYARKNARHVETKRILPEKLAEAEADGWQLKRKGKKYTIIKPKKRAELLEARVWTLFYRMGFQNLSGKGGCKIPVNPKADASPTDQIDVVAADEEVAIAVECKSVEAPRKDATLPAWIARFREMRKRFSDEIRIAVPTESKRHIGQIVFIWDIIVTENDAERAEQLGIRIFDYGDLEYFEALVGHLGVAARYQFLCEIFRSKQIDGLEVKVPALRTKLGRNTCYSFSIRPDYLLKIAYVAHRAKGKAIDVDMYQRMISKNRLKKIAEFISDGGNFPTNIVVNIREKRFVEFQKGEQKGDEDGGTFGWLNLRPAYGCAWVIDGQHRLFAYSGHERSSKAHLNVLAYEALSASEQAQMFVDINSEQRKVKRSLLVELDADLKWNADEEDDRIQAIISKAGLALDEDTDSPLRNMILLADVKRTETRCVSLTSISSALSKAGFFVVARKKDVTEYGPFWRKDQMASLKRAIFVLKAWFNAVSSTAKDWWSLGAGEGGGLAMNNGVTICLNIMRSVMEHLGYPQLVSLENHELAARLEPYARSLGRYFARMDSNDRQKFRQLQGSDGQLMGTRQCQEALRADHPKFSPPQLEEWIESKKKNHNEEGRRIIEEMETTLQNHIIQILKAEYDADGDAWWFEGVPLAIRKKVDERINESGGKAGRREQNFDLVHYQHIITENWLLFKDIFGMASLGGSKDKQAGWIKEVSDMRNIVMHPSRQQFLSADKIQTLQQWIQWLRGNIRKLQAGEAAGADADQDDSDN